MIILYHAGGAGDFSLYQTAGIDWPTLRHNVQKLLRARDEPGAALTLSKLPFVPLNAENHFGDEFLVLQVEVTLEMYERLRKAKELGKTAPFRKIAEILNEVSGEYFRFVVASLAQEAAPVAPPSGLKPSEIIRLVNQYIGVNGGYLVGFSYRTHREFYEELDLAINPDALDGTTRERFISILKQSKPEVQAKILNGILDRLPPSSEEHRTEELAGEIRLWISRLRGTVLVYQPRITSDVVLQTLADADELIRTRGHVSAVDRVHTALHGYLRHVLARADIPTPTDASLVVLFKSMLKEHPAFDDLGARGEDVKSVARSLTAVLDALNPIRNRASRAHPNETVLSPAEAQLAFNAAQAILQYIDDRLALSGEKRASADRPIADVVESR